MEKKFENEVVLVTGSGRRDGIGYSIARFFAERGARVIVTDKIGRKDQELSQAEKQALDQLNQIAEEFNQFGGQSLAVPADLSQEEDLQNLLGQAEAKIGTVTVLVNNAGVCIVKPLLEITLREWELSLQVNLTATFRLTQEVVTRMIAHGIRGNVINISSISGKEGWPDFGAYTATKFGIIGLTQTLAREVASKGVRVNAICPGLIDTAMNQVNNALQAEQRQVDVKEIEQCQINRVPLGRLGSPVDVARVIGFLVSEDGSYMTGQSINVTGGLMVH